MDTCMICFEGGPETVNPCRSCIYSVHKRCMLKWLIYKKYHSSEKRNYSDHCTDNHDDATCLLCKQPCPDVFGLDELVDPVVSGYYLPAHYVLFFFALCIALCLAMQPFRMPLKSRIKSHITYYVAFCGLALVY